MVKKVRDVVRILEDNGFVLDRQKGTSHRQYEGFIGGRRRLVTVVGGRNEDIPDGTLGSIVRQSGLGKKLFR